MKKLLPLLALVLAMALCLSACSLFKKGDETPDETPGENQSGTQNPEEGKSPEEQKPLCNHVTVVDQAKAATCTEDGLTAGAHCSTCNEILVKQEVIPAAHKYGEWEDVKIADCFFDGEQKRICSVCEDEDTQVVPHLEHIFSQNEETKLFACETCDARILNGHLYAAIDIQTHWFEAYELCESIGGHLATITSSDEQLLIENIASKGKDEVGTREWITEEGYWLGAIKNNNGWEWVTGEKFDYVKWDQNEPSNISPEWFLGINGYAEWHDCVYTHNSSSGLKFICEWELDIVESEHYFTEWETATEASCFADGEQYRICTHCGLKETEVLTQLEHNFIFNEATGVNTCEYCAAGLYDGRIYKIFNVSLSWFDAYTYCEKLGGHLVTITSAEEQTFIETYMNSQSFSQPAWIGAYSDGTKWQWVTEEGFEYTNWHSGEPNNSNSYEFFGEINHELFGKWNDLPPFSACYIVCEWEA